MHKKEYLDEAHEDRQESSNVDKDFRQSQKTTSDVETTSMSMSKTSTEHVHTISRITIINITTIFPCSCVSAFLSMSITFDI